MTPERQSRITSVLNHRQPDLTVVLENVEDPHNIFAVMRTCDAVGIQDVYVLNTQIKSHRKYGKGSSSSAAKWVKMHLFEDREACFEQVRKRHDKIVAAHLGEHTVLLHSLNLTERVALVFGNERKGVTEETLQLCDGSFIIPQVGMIQSLNISVACAVSLYEAYRQRNKKGFYDGNPRLPEQEWEALASIWSEKRK